MAAAVSDIEGLFQLPLDEFTAARNALSTQLKKSGRGEEADQVKGLTKPPVSAWTVNQLYWRHRKAFDRLLAAGERFRKAQAAQLGGRSVDLREPLEARRQALADLIRIAATLLRGAGYNPSPDTMRRVTTTLEALATYGIHSDAPRGGRLTDDVDPPGFEAVASLIPTGGRGGGRGSEPTQVIPFTQKAAKGAKKRKPTPEELEKEREEERKAQIAAASAALQEAEKTLRVAQRKAEQAEAALKKAAARAKEAEKAKAALEKQWEKLVTAADETRQEARRVASEAEEAAQELEDAERTLEKARNDLEKL